PFWDAMEAITSTLRPRERLALARSLARSAHVARERRVLTGSEPAPRRELAARRLGFLPSPRSRTALRLALRQGPPNVGLAAEPAARAARGLGARARPPRHAGGDPRARDGAHGCGLARAGDGGAGARPAVREPGDRSALRVRGGSQLVGAASRRLRPRGHGRL